MMEFTQISRAIPQPGAEMTFKTRPTSLFEAQFSNARPASQAVTDISDSDWEDEGEAFDVFDHDSGSEFEEDSPRGSFDSFGQRSGTTASTIDEAQTPMSSRKGLLDINIRRNPSQSTQGPRGPHLFRASIESSRDFSFDYALQLSPVLPADQAEFSDKIFVQSPTEIRPSRSGFEALSSGPVKAPDKTRADSWTSEEVIDWMCSAGFEEEVIQSFEAHDVTGAVLLGLDFGDLKELGITSFGKRHIVWNQLSLLKSEIATSPAVTVFEDSSRSATQNSKPFGQQRCPSNKLQRSASTPVTPGSSRRGRIQWTNHSMDEAITPAESISIVAIEQLLPKPHKCSKGENCSKWKKQKRLREQLDREGFAISPSGGGHILIAGNPADGLSAEHMSDNVARPTSDVVPSVVASSDLFGAGQDPNFSLQEHVKTIEKRDPQESVKQFLNFNHLKISADVPPTPPLETPRFEPAAPTRFNTPPALQANLRHLPKLAIPGRSNLSYAQPVSDDSPCEDLKTSMYGPNRLGTPASEMDVPITRISLGPVAREASQSVPPNMRYRKPVKPKLSSRDAASWRRSSMHIALPTLPENGPPSAHRSTASRNTTRTLYGASTTHAGWMKKRKNKLLRHEWQEHHFRLTGTRLNMHASAKVEDARVLDTIDVDDYAVACSSVGSQSKLTAALKSLKLKKDGTVDDSAFIFQLIPAAERAKMMGLLKDGKTHHFAVKTRDERIDWMREVMLAKALKEKADKGGVACAVTHNGVKVEDIDAGVAE